MNNVVLVGRLTKDPELRTISSGTSVASFTIAVQRNYKTDGEYKADFINCVAWRQTAEFISRYFSKGRPIGVTGNIETRTFDDAEGKRQWRTEVNVREAWFVAGGGEASGSGAQQQASAGQQQTQPNADELFADELNGMPGGNAGSQPGDELDVEGFEPLGDAKLPF